MLENWSGMDKEKAKEYILNCQVCNAIALLYYEFSFWDYQLIFLVDIAMVCCCMYLLVEPLLQSYDGGFGLIPGSESHGERI